MENFHIATRVNGKPHMTLMQIELAVTRNESIDFDIYGYRARYVPERTCKNLYSNSDAPRFCCSICDFKSNLPISEGNTFSYKHCPECGAKVVEEC